jgi:hypothetical protein
VAGRGEPALQHRAGGRYREKREPDRDRHQGEQPRCGIRVGRRGPPRRQRDRLSGGRAQRDWLAARAGEGLEDVAIENTGAIRETARLVLASVGIAFCANAFSYGMGRLLFS